jgi:poly-beta-hydroxybutyrate-responsive repressor
MATSAAGVTERAQPKKFLRPCLLLLLKESPAHGYDLLERLREFQLERDPGGIYRALRSMEHEGLVWSSWESSYRGPDRRRYELTPRGDEFLARWADALDETQRVLARYLDRYDALRPIAESN